MSRPSPHSRADYRHFTTITTRWNDNDPYGHVNNVVYYEWFDTVINEYLIRAGALDIATSSVVGLVVRTGCDYFSPIAFPDLVHAGVKVAKMGNSSVHYQVGIFRNDEDLAAAQGEFVHVYVDRHSRKPVALPEDMRRALERLLVS